MHCKADSASHCQSYLLTNATTSFCASVAEATPTTSPRRCRLGCVVLLRLHCHGSCCVVKIVGSEGGLVDANDTVNTNTLLGCGWANKTTLSNVASDIESFLPSLEEYQADLMGCEQQVMEDSPRVFFDGINQGFAWPVVPWINGSDSSHDTPEAPHRMPVFTEHSFPPSSRTSHKSFRSDRRYFYPQDACVAAFARPKDLQRHQDTVHGLGKELFNCETGFCEFTSKRRDKLLNDCRRKHKQEKEKEMYVSKSSNEPGQYTRYGPQCWHRPYI